MATGTAWYNLTKPASIENYNLNVWNTNLDMIDEQMHQNETEAFTGATELANGTVGNVPAPTIADKDNYLKGDGTWAPVQGGGSTVIPNPTGTPTDTLDTVSIDGTIYEIQGSGGGGSYEVAFEGSNTTSAWASPLTFTEFLLSDYEHIKITATYRGNSYEWLILTSQIPTSGTYNLYEEVYCDQANDNLNMYVSTGYTLTVTKIEGWKSGGGGSIDASTIDFSTLTAAQITQLQTLLGIN